MGIFISPAQTEQQPPSGMYWSPGQSISGHSILSQSLSARAKMSPFVYHNSTKFDNTTRNFANGIFTTTSNPCTYLLNIPPWSCTRRCPPRTCRWCTCPVATCRHHCTPVPQRCSRAAQLKNYVGYFHQSYAKSFQYELFPAPSQLA